VLVTISFDSYKTNEEYKKFSLLICISHLGYPKSDEKGAYLTESFILKDIGPGG